MLKIAHIGPHGYQNAGDIYLVWAMQKIFGPAHWVNIPAKKVFGNQDIDELNQNDAIVIGPGGLILPDSYNFISPSGWQVGIPTELIKHIKPPIIVYAVGWNLFRNQEPSQLLKENLTELISKAAFFSLRHRGNITKVESLTGILGKIKLNFCPSVVVEPWQDIQSNNVAFQIAGDRIEIRTGNTKEFINNIASLCGQLNVNKFFVAHTISDLEINALLADMCNGNFVNLLGCSPDKLRDFYYGIDTTFTMRGHGQMIPFGLGCKVVSLVSHDKVRNFLEDLDMLQTGVEVQNPLFVQNCLDVYQLVRTFDFRTRRKIVEDNIHENMKEIKCL